MIHTVTQVSNNAGPFSFDFATIGGAGQTATVSLVNGGLTLQVVSDNTVVASSPLGDITRLDITGQGNDSLILDFTTPFALPITFAGAAGDSLSILGGNLTAQYIPTAGITGAGNIQVGTGPGSSIAFTGISVLNVSALASFAFISSGGSDNITIDSPAAAVNRITGTTDGTAFVPVAFSDVGSVSVDTGANDSGVFDDTIIIPSSGLVAAGLQNFSVTTGSGNDMLLYYADSYALPVAGGTFAFDGGAGSNTLVGPSPSASPGMVLTNVDQSIPVPVIVLPGLSASFAKPAYTADFFSTLGMPQSELELDPIENTYADLVQSLKNVGYQEGLTLFESPYDWRLPVAPQDGNLDGSLSNLSVAELTGGTYHYMVDYFGTALVTAAQAWASAFDGRSLPAVNVITHSTGALLARSYVQSPAYGQAYAPGQYLPKINDAVLMAPPNQGDTETWNYLNNNFSLDVEARVIDLVITLSYNAVANLGQTITSPNGDITRDSILVNGQPSIQQFENLYVPSFQDLQASFPFINTGAGSLTVGSAAQRNNFLLDLNDGLGLDYTIDNIPPGADPNSFLDSPTNSFLGKVYVEYSSTQDTLNQVTQQPAGTGSIVPLGSIFSETPTTTWYQDVAGSQNGDGTLTVTSTIGQFSATDPKVVLEELTQDGNGSTSVIHSKIPTYSTALGDMLGDLGQPDSSALISQGLSNFNATGLADSALSLIPGPSFNFFGLTFDASQLHLAYDSDTNVYELTGPSSLTIPDIGTIDVNLGGGSTHGLVLTGSEFTSLDMTVTSNLTIGGLEFQADDLVLSYQASTGTFVMTGGADFSLKGNTVDVTFGGPDSSGLVIEDGALASLDMTLDSNISLVGVTFTTNGLRATYDAAHDQFTLSGSAGVTLGDVTDLTVNFGGSSTQGLVITNGALDSVDASVTGNFEVDGVSIAATDLEFQYIVGDSTFAMTGTASVTLADDVSFSVTFGHDADPGLVVADSALASLDLTVDANFTVAAVTITATDLEFQYTVSGSDSTFDMTGTASVGLTDGVSFSVTFGHDADPGLVVADGALSSLDMTVDGEFTVAAVSFTATDLEFQYTVSGSDSTFAMSGTAGVALTDGVNFSVTFGHDAKSGLVITDGAISSLDMTVDADFTVAGVAITAKDLEFQYTVSGADNTFAMTGTASVALTDGVSFSVTFGHDADPGLVITDGALSSLDLTVDGNFTVAAVTFTAEDLEFQYTVNGSDSTFAMSGKASVALTNNVSFSVTFGHDSDPGLVITDGAISSLDMTVNGEFTVAAVSVTAQDLEFQYTVSGLDSTFAMFGTASVAIQGLGDLSVTFGHDAKPGLVITDGALSSLDMTVNSTFTVAEVTITAQDLEFQYTVNGADSTFAMTGTGSVAIEGLGDLSVTFGHGADPGLVITDGALSSLDMTVNANFAVAAVTITAQDLEFKYTVSDSTFAMFGTAGVAIEGLGELSVTFGHGADPGLVIADGALSSLDMTVNANFTVAAVTITAQDLEFQYTVSDSTFAMFGTAGVSIQGLGDISVTFGFGSNPGLVIQSGALQSLDMTVDSDIHVGSVDFSTNGLRFTYTVSNSLFTLAGTAGVSVTGIGNLSVTFGFDSSPGLVIQSGALQSLDMTVDSKIQVGSVDFSTNGLRFTYTVSNSLFTLAGTAGVSVTGIGNFSVTFGFGTNPGLVIQNGALQSLDMTVNSNIRVGSLNFSTNGLRFTYTVSNSLFTLAGTAGVSVSGIGNFSVTFGFGSNPGLVIQDGVLQSLDMTVNSQITVAALAFNLNNMNFTYVAATSTFTMTGNASVAVANVGSLSVTFGGPSTTGLVVQGGTLQSLDMTVNSNFKFGSFTFIVSNMTFDYSSSSRQFTLTGSASVQAGFDTFTAQLGGSGSTGLVVRGGSLVSLDATLSTTFGVQGFSIGSVSLHMAYVAGTGGQGATYTFGGHADLTLQVPLPSVVTTFLGIPSDGWHLGTIGFNVQYVVGNNGASFSQVYIGVAGVTVGLTVSFTGNVQFTINGEDAVTYVEDVVANAIKSAWNAVSNWFASWGYLSGATVYFDANRNMIHDPGEPMAVTGSDGSFTMDLSSYPDLSDGQFVVTGGTDISTGLPNTAVLTAPGFAKAITPLSALVNQVVQTGVAPDQANSLVAQALGIDPSFDLSFVDPIQLALGGDASAAQIFAAEVKVSDMVYQVDGMLNGSSGASSTTYSNDTLASLASMITTADGAALDLDSDDTTQQLLDQTSSMAGIALDPTVSAGAAAVLAGVNAYVDSLPVVGDQQYVNQVVQSQVVAEASIAPQLAQAGAGNVDIGQVVNQNSGTALIQQAQQAPTGTLPIHSSLAVAVGAATYGAAASVTVTVNSDSGALPGTVTLAIDGGASLSQVLGSDGTATFTISGLAAGDHSLHADYIPPQSSNYLANSGDGTLHVDPRALTITATGASKVYDGTTTTTASLSDNRVAGDDIIVSYASAGFADANAGVGKTITVSGITVSGPDAADYSFDPTIYTTGAITPRTLTVAISGTPTKTYDGSATATLNSGNFSLSNLVGGEGFTVTQSAGTYNSAHVAAANTVSISLSNSDFTPGGSTLASNYGLPSSANGSGAIQAYAFAYQIGNDSQQFGNPANLAHDLGTSVATGIQVEKLAIAYSSPGDTATAPAGTYPITGTLSNATGMLGDYKPTLLPGTLTVTGGVAPRSAYILSPHASGAVTASGNASVVLPGGLFVDSDSASAIAASGNSQVNVGNAVLVAGGVSKSGNAQITKTGTPPFTSDPLAALGLPSPGGLTNFGAVVVSGNSSRTLVPGIYTSIQVSGNASATLSSGWYILEGGGLSVSGNANLTGNGVFLFNAGSLYNGTTDGGSFGSISLGGNGIISLSPLSSGPYAGVDLFQSRSNARALALGGNGAGGVAGIIYAPDAAVGLSGNAQLTGSLVASTLSVTGNAGAFQLASGNTADYASSSSNWIANGILTVAIQDDTGNGIDPNEMHQLGEAMAYLNDALGSFGVMLSWAVPGSTADVQVHFSITTPQGGASDGVLGFTTAANDVYLVTSWNFYTGDDPALIGAGQYDFLTLATHELAHTVGLGESIDPASVLYEYLSPGDVRRTLTDGNLAQIDTNADRFMKVESDNTLGRMQNNRQNDGLEVAALIGHQPLSAEQFGRDASGNDSRQSSIFGSPVLSGWSEQMARDNIFTGFASGSADSHVGANHRPTLARTSQDLDFLIDTFFSGDQLFANETRQLLS